MPTNDWINVNKEAKKFDELGSTGLKRSGNRGFVDEELLQQLRGTRGLKIYQEMRENDATVGAFILAIEWLIRGVEWTVEGGDEEQVMLIESCLNDMSHTWSDFIAEALSMLPYGFSWHEIVYKRRTGDRNKEATSRYDDGKIGWRKLPIRAQDTLSEWVFDDQGGVQAFVQLAPPHYNRVEISIDRSLLFRTGMHKGNPEGRSVLRSAFRSWWFKKRLEEIEGLGIERDLAGLPVFYATKAVSDKFGDELKRIIRNIRRDEQEGLILPLIVDPDTKEKELSFELLGAPGKRQLDISPVIDRYDKRIAMTVLADFLLLGQSQVGSYALSTNKTKLFSAALAAILDAISNVMNRHAIPRLLALNGMMMNVEEPTILRHGDIDAPDFGELTRVITSLAGAGMPLFPDEELENYLRKQLAWPKRPDDIAGMAPPAKGKEAAPPTEPEPKPKKVVKPKPKAAKPDE